MQRPSSPTARILSNAGWLLLAEALGRLLSLVAIMALARALSPAEMGMLELGLSSYNLLTLVALGGIEVLAVRRVARTAAGLDRIAGVQVLVGWMWALPALLVVLVGLHATEQPAPAPGVVGGFAAIALLAPLSMRFAFRGRERMAWLAFCSVLGQLGWASSALVFVARGLPLVVLPWLLLAAEGLRVGLLLSGFRWQFGPIRMPRRRQLVAWTRASVPASAGRIARGLLYFIDLLLLGLFAPLSEVGLYAVALRLPLFAITAAAMVQQAVFPRVAQLLGRRELGGQGALMHQTLLAATALGLSAALTLGDAGGAWLSTLFGERFRAAAPLMAILCWRIPLSAAAGLLRNLVCAADPLRDARIAQTATATAAAAVVLGAWAFGATGCAWGMVFGEAVSCLLYGRAARGSMRWPDSTSTPVLASMAVAAVALAGWLWRPDGLGDSATMLGALCVGAVAGGLPAILLAREARARDEALRLR